MSDVKTYPILGPGDRIPGIDEGGLREPKETPPGMKSDDDDRTSPEPNLMPTENDPRDASEE